MITVPDAGVMFTGDLVETGQFAIFPWFPPHDTDVSGTRWIEVMRAAGRRSTRGSWSPATATSAARSCWPTSATTSTLLRDETWRRQDSAMSEETIVEEVTRR